MTDSIWAIFLAGLVLLFAWSMRRALRRSTVTNRLITEYIDRLQDPKLIVEIYAYCQQDGRLRRLVERNQAQREDFQQLYEKLLLWGNFKKGRRFVPISSFFFTTSLDYLLKNRDGDPKKLTMKMMNFFHI